MDGKLLSAETCDPTIPTVSTRREPMIHGRHWQSLILRDITSPGGGSTNSAVILNPHIKGTRSLDNGLLVQHLFNRLSVSTLIQSTF